MLRLSRLLHRSCVTSTQTYVNIFLYKPNNVNFQLNLEFLKQINKKKSFLFLNSLFTNHSRVQCNQDNLVFNQDLYFTFLFIGNNILFKPEELVILFILDIMSFKVHL